MPFFEFFFFLPSVAVSSLPPVYLIILFVPSAGCAQRSRVLSRRASEQTNRSSLARIRESLDQSCQYTYKSSLTYSINSGPTSSPVVSWTGVSGKFLDRGELIDLPRAIFTGRWGVYMYKPLVCLPFDAEEFCLIRSFHRRLFDVCLR